MSDAPAPVVVADLFPILRSELLTLLAGLSADQWQHATVCSGWSVKDIAAHLLGGDIANLSRRRDGWSAPLAGATPATPDLFSFAALVAALNAWNEAWVDVARRMSGPVLCELLAGTGEALERYFRSLDLSAMGEPVSWAGPQAAPVWLDIAREYTEQWLHQAQVRDAIGAGGLREPRLFAPVLATFVHALPRALVDVPAAPGARVRLVIVGDAGGAWDAVRSDAGWRLEVADQQPAVATAVVDQEQAWRLWTKGLSADAAARALRLSGDRRPAARVGDMVSIIA